MKGKNDAATHVPFFYHYTIHWHFSITLRVAKDGMVVILPMSYGHCCGMGRIFEEEWWILVNFLEFFTLLLEKSDFWLKIDHFGHGNQCPHFAHHHHCCVVFCLAGIIDASPMKRNVLKSWGRAWGGDMIGTRKENQPPSPIHIPSSAPIQPKPRWDY